jgi:dipeptidyl aminopeptidase/acylaminoacyl peptidase
MRAWPARLILLTLVFGVLGLTSVAPARATFPGQNGLIALYDDNGVLVIAADGSSRRYLYAGGISPHWSADGQRVYFVSTSNGRIYSIKPDQTGLRTEVWKLTGYTNRDPYPLPGGGVVFDRLSNNCCSSDLWLKEPGHPARRLTSTADAEFLPAVSPNGSRIAYLRDTSQGTFLYLMNRDGSGVRRLRRAVFDGGVDWSPDGETIVFARVLPNGFTEGVFFYHLASNTVTRVGKLESFEAGWGALSFSPDGRRLLIASDSCCGDFLYSTNLSGGDRQDIPVAPPGEYEYYFGGGYWQPVP